MSPHTNRHRFTLVAGGTGGHLFPAVAVLEELAKRNHTANLLCDKRAALHLSRQAITTKTRRIVAVSPRGGLLAKVRFVPLFAIGFCQALIFFLADRPTTVLVFGGYVSAPTALAAWLLRIPVILHEQNRVLGWANRRIAHFARHLALSFTDTDGLQPKWQKRAVVTGMPIRQEIISAATPYTLPKDKTFRLLVLGGSQGAEAFDSLLPKALARLTPESRTRLTITQQTDKTTELQTQLQRTEAVQRTCTLFLRYRQTSRRQRYRNRSRRSQHSRRTYNKHTSCSVDSLSACHRRPPTPQRTRLRRNRGRTGSRTKPKSRH